MLEAVRAARVLGDVAADRAHLLAGGIGRVVEPVGSDRLGHLEVRHAGLDDDSLRVEVDVEHAVHARQRDHDTLGDRERAAGEAGAGAARDEGDPVLVAGADDRLDVLRRLDQADRGRDHPPPGQPVALVGAEILGLEQQRVRGQHGFERRDELGLERHAGDSKEAGRFRPGPRRGIYERRSGSMAVVEFQQVSKVFPDGTKAVADLELDVADGEFMVLVGPSGCGKTTALRMVAGLEDVTSGVIKIGERVVNYVPSRDRDIAMVFQSYALYPHLNVYENIAFGLRVKKLPKAEIDRRVKEAARVLDLEPFLKRKPRALSGGQRQRVAMGRAIVRQPQAFLMDEPLSNLDAKLRVQMRAEISGLQKRLGVTTIYVTHDQIEAMTMGDRVAVMRKGELQQVAHPQVLYDRPVNLFVGGFIGSPAMNMLEATLERGTATSTSSWPARSR